MKKTGIQLANKNFADVLEYLFGHGDGVYNAEELKRINTILQCMRENGYHIVIRAIQPTDNPITPAELKESISICLGIYDLFKELLTPLEKYNSFTKREKQLFRLFAFYNSTEIEKITRLKSNYLLKVRQRMNEKINCHSPAEFKEFFLIVKSAGAVIPAWNAKMRKGRLVRSL